jgi:Tfp pilus assembly protein PilZ
VTMKPKPGNDRRLNPRITADVRCWLERESITLLGTVMNMSSAGLFLRTPVILPVGHRVSLKINVGQGIVEVLGYVVWSVSSKENKRYSGLGICFDEIVGGKNLLERFIEQKTLADKESDPVIN